MKFFGEIITGEFISRHNRFIVYAKINGRRTKTYMPNPGRLLELLYPGSLLYIEKRPEGSKAKIPYTVVAVDRDGNPVMLHTHKANDVVEYLLRNKKIEALKKYEVVRREAQHGRSRMDFLLTDGKKECFLEVKSCTLFEGSAAMFPDAVTERGRKHLIELAELDLKKTGMGKPKVIFLIGSHKVKSFMPDYHTDIEFSKTFLDIKDKIDIYPLSIGWNKDLSLKGLPKEVVIPWKFIKKECHDKGDIFVSFELKKKTVLELGDSSLGFDKGWYVFLDSIDENLQKAMESIKRGSSFFSAGAVTKEVGCKGVLAVRGRSSVRDELERGLKKISLSFIDGGLYNFSHYKFYFFEDEVFKLKSFQELLLHYRIKRHRNEKS